jgi:hypothetical protein
MFKLRKKYHNVTIYHNIMGAVTLYREADQELLKLWHKFLPEAVTYTEPKVENQNDANDIIEAIID